MAFPGLAEILVNKPVVSILMAVHAQADCAYFFDAVNSITLQQTLRPDELVIVDDGSDFLQQDEVQCFLTSLSQYIRIITLPITLNSGFGYCLQRGMELCTGDFIVRMDPDDISLPTRVYSQLKFLLANPHCDLCGTSAYYFKTSISDSYVGFTAPVLHNECLRLLPWRDPLIHPSVMFNKSYFVKAGNYSSLRKNQDTELWLRGFLSGCRFANLSEPLIYFRLNNNLITRRKNISHLSILLLLRLKIIYKLQRGFLAVPFHLISFLCFTFLPVKIISLFYRLRDMS